MKNFNSLPSGYEKLKTEKPYINLGKLPEGEHRFRIVSRPIAGWIDWKDRKPYRFTPENKPATSFDPEKPMKAFWAMYVWDYAKEALFIMEITQSGIRKSLENYAMNEDWGDLTSYDIKIKKEGSGMETKYDVIPVPPKPLSKAIKEIVAATPIRLEALYEGKDPWIDLEPSEARVNDPEELSEEQMAKLDAAILEIDDENVEKFICKRAQVDSIYGIPKAKFDGVMEYLQKQLKEKRMSHESAASA
jgi:hypothetical protein